MKNIKRKILQIILTVFMVFSSCFLTGTVKAEDTTSNTGSSNYFTNNLIVESDSIINNSNFKGEKPTFEPSDSENGSDLSEGATEGQVWTNKIIEKAGQDGMYKITFQAIGFKYRYVDDENEKDNDIWKNPLKEGTSLSITEDIDSNFHVVTNDDVYKMNVTKFIGFETSNDIGFTSIESDKKVVLTFNANDVTGFDKTHSDGFKYSENDDVAFDVEAVFYVRVDNSVVAGTYETKDANSSFEPATDNFYYYEWGSTKTESTYGYDGINWNNSEDGMKGIVNVQNIEIPSGVSGQNIIFSIGNQGTNNIKQPEDKERGPGNYIPTTPKKTDERYYYLDVKNNLNLDWDNLKIKNLYFYWYAKAGSGDQKEALMRIEIQYTDDSWTVFTPVNPLNNNGGNEPAGTFWSETIISKDDPIIRNDRDPDGDGIINETFNNHGRIVLRELNESDLQATKSATLKDWDERTYKIDLYASHNIKPEDKVANIMLMLDVSGSMPWFVTAPTGEQTNLISLMKDSDAKKNETLSKNNGTGTLNEWEYTYYVKRLGEGDSEEYKPIAYTDGEERVPVGTNKTQQLTEGWYTIKSDSNGNKVFQVDEKDEYGNITTQGSVLYSETIYTRNPGVDKTKLEALYTALDYFIENIEDISPTSKIAYVQFAGEVKGSSGFVVVNNIDAEEIINGCKLYGGTNQYAAIKKANEIINTAQSDATSGITKDNTYAILFTDGDLSKNNKKPNTDPAQYYSVADVTNIANTMKTNYVNLLFGAGIFAQLADGSDNAGVTSLKEWVSTDPVNNSSKLVYIGKNSDELINEFSEIFGKITFQISNADIIDYIDKRFIITDENGKQLKPNDKFAGGTIGYDKSKGEYYIKWEDVNLSYSQNGLTGWHQTIYVKAKDEYIGGNDVTTNGSGSGIIVGDVKKEFNQPKVNVKVDFVVGNADDTIFLGEAPLGNAKNKLFGTIKNSNGTTLTMAPDGTDLEMSDFDFDWYTNVDENMNNVVEGSKINSSDISSTRPTSKEVYYLQVKLNSAGSATPESTTNTGGNSNTEENYLLATNDMDGTNKVGEGLNSQGNNISEYAKESSKYGVYIVDVVSGSITINKEINKMTDNDSQGDPIFTFHITGTTVSGKKVNEYRSIRFEEQDDLNQLVATIAGLEKGQYTIAELDTVRYEFNSVTINNVTDQACSNSNDKITNCYIGYQSESNDQTDINRKNVSVTYINNLINENDQTDTDIITNSFIVSKNGIVISAEDYIEGNE